MGHQQNSIYYNDMFSQKFYTGDIKTLPCYPVWKTAANHIVENNVDIMDLGCGPGHLAEMLNNTPTSFKYKGYDFSEVAIQIAKNKKLDPRFSFETVDLSTFKFASDGSYVALEFFEHVEFDVQLIERMDRGSNLVFSLPTFDDPGHVRFYRNKDDIHERYHQHVNIYSITMPTNNHFFVKSIVR